MTNEQAFQEALDRSGVTVEPGKRYTVDEVVAIAAASGRWSTEMLSQEAIASLLGVDRKTVNNEERSATEMLRFGLEEQYADHEPFTPSPHVLRFGGWIFQDDSLGGEFDPQGVAM